MPRKEHWKSSADLRKDPPPAGRPWLVRWALPTADNYHRYVCDRTEALAKVDEVLSHHPEIEVPMDYYDRQTSIETLRVWVEHFDGARWTRDGETRERVYGVRYHD